MGRKRTHCAICHKPLTEEEIDRQEVYCQDCIDEQEQLDYADMDSSYNPFISQEELDRRQKILDDIDKEYEECDNYEYFSDAFYDDDDDDDEDEDYDYDDEYDDESEYYDDYGFDNVDIWDESISKALFAEIHKNATKLKESRALPGGNLDSKEVTDYEKWLEKIHTKQDKAKVKEDENWAPKLFNKECSENGYHDWEGNKLSSVKEFVKQFYKK